MKTNSTIIAASERTQRNAGCKPALLCGIAASLLLAGTAAHAQVNSGSNGSDGAFHPTTNIVINMADHPNGIYHYTSVNISNGVTVTFIPNANNTPVVWLVQSNCMIDGVVDLSGEPANGALGGLGGPGGWRGGNGLPTTTGGSGPGGGSFSVVPDCGIVADGTFGNSRCPPRGIYGNSFLLPLLGGSGGGGSQQFPTGGGGGGGAILIAATGTVAINGRLFARGSHGYGQGGLGSGGGVRLVASVLVGQGLIFADGGNNGRVRLDVLDRHFSGAIAGVLSEGFQPIIIPSIGQLPQLTVTSVGGVPVSASPTGTLSTPDAVLSAQQNNPIPIVVRCSNLPLNTQITVSVKPANGAAVSATGLNNTGTLSSSTATVLINMPRGGGLIYATAATGN